VQKEQGRSLPNAPAQSSWSHRVTAALPSTACTMCWLLHRCSPHPKVTAG
jgi:hypothetical protein